MSWQDRQVPGEQPVAGGHVRPRSGRRRRRHNGDTARPERHEKYVTFTAIRLYSHVHYIDPSVFDKNSRIELTYLCIQR